MLFTWLLNSSNKTVSNSGVINLYIGLQVDIMRFPVMVAVNVFILLRVKAAHYTLKGRFIKSAPNDLINLESIITCTKYILCQKGKNVQFWREKKNTMILKKYISINNTILTE